MLSHVTGSVWGLHSMQRTGHLQPLTPVPSGWSLQGLPEQSWVRRPLLPFQVGKGSGEAEGGEELLPGARVAQRPQSRIPGRLKAPEHKVTGGRPQAAGARQWHKECSCLHT